MSSDVTSPRSISQLEFPTPERLLPVGPQRDISRLAERVRQALGVPDIDGILDILINLHSTNFTCCLLILFLYRY